VSLYEEKLILGFFFQAPIVPYITGKKFEKVKCKNVYLDTM